MQISMDGKSDSPLHKWAKKVGKMQIPGEKISKKCVCRNGDGHCSPKIILMIKGGDDEQKNGKEAILLIPCSLMIEKVEAQIQSKKISQNIQIPPKKFPHSNIPKSH
jgi:hypothetical protein